MKTGQSLIALFLAVLLSGCTGAEIVAASAIGAFGAHVIGEEQRLLQPVPKRIRPTPTPKPRVEVASKPARTINAQPKQESFAKQQQIRQENERSHANRLAAGLSHYKDGRYADAFRAFRLIDTRFLSVHEKEQLYLHLFVTLKLSGHDHLISSYVQQAKEEDVDVLHSHYINDFHPIHRAWIQTIARS